MSFLRHREIYRSDGGTEAGSGEVAAPCLIVSMSLRLAIPWPVALQQSRPPLHQLGPLCTQPAGKTTIFQRMAKAGLTACLSLGVHAIGADPRVRPHNQTPTCAAGQAPSWMHSVNPGPGCQPRENGLTTRAPKGAAQLTAQAVSPGKTSPTRHEPCKGRLNPTRPPHSRFTIQRFRTPAAVQPRSGTLMLARGVNPGNPSPKRPQLIRGLEIAALAAVARPRSFFQPHPSCRWGRSRATPPTRRATHASRFKRFPALAPGP